MKINDIMHERKFICQKRESTEYKWDLSAQFAKIAIM